MRVLDLAAGIAALALVTPGALSAQSFGDAAAKEKARRKAAEAKTKKPAPTFTNDDLGRAGGGNASFTEGGPAEGADKDKKDGTAPGDKPAEKTDDDKQAEAAALWRKNLDTASKNVTIYRDTVNRIQADLNDTSGGFYSARRTTLMTLQEETKKKLADAERLVGDLEDQGRRSGYR